MSAVFHITDKKKMFNQAPVLTVTECLDLIEDLVQFSFDETDEDFSLEVSSCGISAPLTQERQYIKNIGREVEVKTTTSSHTGVIQEVSEGKVTLEVTSRQPKPQGKGKITVTEQILLPIEEIKEAKLKLKF